MTLDKIVVTLLSISGIGFVYWFFLMKKEDLDVAVSSGNVDIVVEGGYSPSVISISNNKQTTLNFLRKDPSSCLEEIVIPEFKVRKYLNLNEKTAISITPKRAGEFELSCGMNMFHGKIIVK